MKQATAKTNLDITQNVNDILSDITNFILSFGGEGKKVTLTFVYANNFQSRLKSLKCKPSTVITFDVETRTDLVKNVNFASINCGKNKYYDLRLFEVKNGLFENFVNIKEIYFEIAEPSPPKKVGITNKQLENLLEKLHPNFFTELKDRIKNYLSGASKEHPFPYMDKLTYKPLSSFYESFPYRNYITPNVEFAFNNGNDFQDKRCGQKRDFSIEISKEKDFAWFSSEYSGCGNGDYYYLINPTTVLFIEKD